MQRKLGSVFFSSETGCSYRVIRGGRNSCDGCVFSESYDNGDTECFKPDDAGWCVGEDRRDGIDIIFKEA